VRSVVILLLAAVHLVANPDSVSAQVPVLDERMVEHNIVQTAQQVLEGAHEDQMVDFFLYLRTKLSYYDWRDLDGVIRALDELLADGHAITYIREDLGPLLDETFPGYHDHVDWARHHTERLGQLQATYRAVLLSLQEQEQRWNESLNGLQTLRDAITGSVSPGNSDGEGARQTMMELRAAARAIGQEENMLIRQALLNRSLARNLQLADAAHRRGNEAATLERMLGVGDD
jgi:hypothetical protein